MIISDREIKAALARGVIALTPLPPDRAWSSTAVDLRLANELVLWKNPSGSGAQVTIAPAHPQFDFHALLKNFGARVVG